MNRNKDKGHSQGHGHGRGSSVSSGSGVSVTSKPGRSSWRRNIITLHKNLFGTDITEKEVQTGLEILDKRDSATSQNKFNDTRATEGLKIHLIIQGKDKEAKQFVQLARDLKKSNFLNNREAIVEFLDHMFDKEPSARGKLPSKNINPPTVRVSSGTSTRNDTDTQTVQSREHVDDGEKAVLNGSPTRAAVTGVKAAVATYGDKLMTMQKSPSNSRLSIGSFANTNGNGLSPNGRKSELIERPNVTLRRSGQYDIKSETFSPPSKFSIAQDVDTVDYGRAERDLGMKRERESRSRPPSTATSQPFEYHMDGLFEPIPIPRLERESDAATREEIHRSTNRMPSLTPSNLSSTTTTWTVFNAAGGVSSPSKVITLPSNYGRNLLSSTSTISSVDAFSGFQQSRPSAAVSSLNSESVPYLKSQPSSSRSRPFSNQFALEKELIKDLVYIFQGIDGHYLKVKPGEKYEVDVGIENLHPSLKKQALRLCEIGYSYKRIKNWCERPTTELMAQGFKFALERELQEFYRLLAVIQSTIQQTVTADTPMSEEMPKLNAGEDLTVLKLTVWVFESRVRMEVVASMIETCGGKRGGEMCSLLFRYTQHGDPMISSMSSAILSVVAKPMYVMLCQWILYGELEDPHNEFFIAADKECKLDQLWHSMYRIREKMLPSFISKALAEKILATGKNINFLKHICENKAGYAGRDDVMILLEATPVECIFLEEDKILKNAIDQAYRTTSEMVLKVLINEARLLDHLKAIKRYLLLGQGDFIQYLLELLQDELSKPASKIFSHNLTSILESAIRATNAQFEDEEVLGRLDTRTLLSNDSDSGWEIFCLDYKANGPIGTVLTLEVMDSYNQLFNSLWRMKRVEAILSTLWKNQTALFKCQKVIPELGTVLHRSQLLISELIHFVHQTQYYIMFEATECAWDSLMEKVNKAKDLDEVIVAHEDFIQTIMRRSLLDVNKNELLTQLRSIFNYVHELKGFLAEFEERVMVEMKRRKQRNIALRLEANKEFFTQCVAHAKSRIEALYVRTQDMVRSFLLLLNRLQDPDSLTLQCLSFRLDFNEYYALKDSRLSFPLTYQHRRLSANAFSPSASASQSASGIGLNSQTASQLGLGLATSMSISEVFEDN